MEKKLIALAVVVLANTGFAQMKKSVDQAVDKSLLTYGNISCMKNPTHTIQCKGKNFYSSKETYELNLEYKQSCFYYRYSDEGFWSIDLSLENNEQKEKVVHSSGYNFNTASLNEFKIDFFTEGQPFQINILKTDDVVTSLELKKLKSDVYNTCKAGSALSDDHCLKTTFSFVTEEYLFRDMECIETVK